MVDRLWIPTPTEVHAESICGVELEVELCSKAIDDLVVDQVGVVRRPVQLDGFDFDRGLASM